MLQEGEGEAEVAPQDIDGFWLQKKLGEHYEEPRIVVEMEQAILTILGEKQQLHDCENKLAMLFEFEHFDLLKLLLQNRDKVYYCVRLAQT